MKLLLGITIGALLLFIIFFIYCLCAISSECNKYEYYRRKEENYIEDATDDELRDSND